VIILHLKHQNSSIAANAGHYCLFMTANDIIFND
jgi:hypothetical protein